MFHMYMSNALHHSCDQDAYQLRHHPLGVWVAGHVLCNPLEVEEGVGEPSEPISSPVVLEMVLPKMTNFWHQLGRRLVPGQLFHERLIHQ